MRLRRQERVGRPLRPEAPKNSVKKSTAWSSRDETAVLLEMAEILRSGLAPSVQETDDYWDNLHKKVRKKLEGNWTRKQLFEKVRRLKRRYMLMENQVKIDHPFPYKDAQEEECFELWKQIWRRTGPLRLHLEEEEVMDMELPSEHGNLYYRQGEAMKSQIEVTEKEQEHSKKKVIDPTKNNAEGQHSVILATKDHPDQGAPSPEPGKTVPEENNFSKKKCENYGEGSHEPRLENDPTAKSDRTDLNTEQILKDLHSEHQTFLKDVQNRYQQVLQQLFVKFVAIANNSVKAVANEVPFLWLGGLSMSPVDFIHPSLLQLAGGFGGTFLTDNMGEKYKAAVGELQKGWERQHLQELKALSGRLQLLLEQCQIQQEQLEHKIGDHQL